MSKHKVVFVGPSGAGKTTAIQTVSRSRSGFNEYQQSGPELQHNMLFGQAVDYELINLRDGQTLQLLGTQGSQNSDTIQVLLHRGVAAVVIMISNAVPNPLANLREQLLQIGELAKTTRIVVGLSHMDVKADPGATVFSRELHKFEVFECLEHNIPLLVVDPRDPQDMALLLETALYIRKDDEEQELA